MISVESVLNRLGNATVTIKRYVSQSLTIIKTGVRCAIVHSKLDINDDETFFRDQRIRGARGRIKVYMSSDEDVKKDDLIIDGNRTLMVLNDTFPYVAKGLIVLDVIEEQA